ncbi:MAG TPA: hypothetical protein VKP67_21550 [Xanthobacteraceae bacterium]|nr:hypothetical protein [Xanthobacteraceae bacterium]
MPVRTSLIVAAGLIGSASVALADGASGNKTRHRHIQAAPVAVALAPAPSAFGGRLVMRPAWNIACNTRDSGTRALPCNQPVWVYGSPCEIGLGRGFYRNCD